MVSGGGGGCLGEKPQMHDFSTGIDARLKFPALTVPDDPLESDLVVLLGTPVAGVLPRGAAPQIFPAVVTRISVDVIHPIALLRVGNNAVQILVLPVRPCRPADHITFARAVGFGASTNPLRSNLPVIHQHTFRPQFIEPAAFADLAFVSGIHISCVSQLKIIGPCDEHRKFAASADSTSSHLNRSSRPNRYAGNFCSRAQFPTVRGCNPSRLATSP